MKHNLRRVLHLTQARDFAVRGVRAWRRLLPDWTPTLDALRALDTRPHEHIAAVRFLSEDWDYSDPRWDVLLALLEWERRDVRRQLVDDELASLDRAMERAARVSVPDFLRKVADEGRETDLAWDPEGTVPTLRPVHDQQDHVRADVRPAEPGLEDGEDEAQVADLHRTARPRLAVERTGPHTFAVHTLREAHGDDD